MNMSNHLAANVQFCDEYEDLFHKCLDALAQWNELRGFHQQSRGTGTRANSALRRAQQNYSATFLELRAHARKCVVCEEMLQAHLNDSGNAVTYRVI